MEPFTPVRRTGARMPGLSALRQDDAVDHVDDAVGRGDVGLHDLGPVNGHPATIGNGIHISFLADSAAAVNAFHAAALEAGAANEGEPGRRPHYGPAYYGCFVRDPDGHKIEAMYWDAVAGLEAETHPAS